MKVIFYDRKNKREVSNEELVFINLTETICITDDEIGLEKHTKYRIDSDTGVPISKEEFEHNKKRKNCITNFEDLSPLWTVKMAIPKSNVIGTIGYKSKTCPKYKNWDLYCTESDLVFLRLES